MSKFLKKCLGGVLLILFLPFTILGIVFRYASDAFKHGYNFAVKPVDWLLDE